MTVTEIPLRLEPVTVVRCAAGENRVEMTADETIPIPCGRREHLPDEGEADRVVKVPRILRREKDRVQHQQRRRREGSRRRPA